VFRPLRELADDHGFRVALLTGLGIATVCVAVKLLVRRRSPLPVAGIAACAGSCVALFLADTSVHRPGALIAGLGALAIAGIVSDALDLGYMFRVLLVVPGAVFISNTFVTGGREFVRPFLVIAMLLGAAAAIAWDKYPVVAPAGPLVLLITAAGIYACAPDTEHAAVVLGAIAPIALLGWPLGIARVGGGGASAFVGLVVWLAGTDAAARAGAVVGAVACLGVLVLLPLSQVFPARKSNEHHRKWPAWAFVVLTHALVVLACSRVAGLRESAWVAAGVAAVAWSAGVLFLGRALPGRVGKTITR
jgi:hypothetical protein